MVPARITLMSNASGSWATLRDGARRFESVKGR